MSWQATPLAGLIPGLDPRMRRIAEARLTWWVSQGYGLSRSCACLDSLQGRRPRHAHTMCGWLDHVHLWRRGGRPAALTSQPYGLSLDAEASLLHECARRGLDYVLLPDRSWWAPGGTTLIVVASPADVARLRVAAVRL